MKQQAQTAHQPHPGGGSGQTPQNSRTSFEQSLAGLTVQQQQERLTPPKPVVQMKSNGPTTGSGKDPWDAEGEKFLWADPTNRFPKYGEKMFKDPSMGDYVYPGYMTWAEFKKTDKGQEAAKKLKFEWEYKHPKVNPAVLGMGTPQGGPRVVQGGSKDRSGVNKALGILDGFTSAITSTKGGAFASGEFKVDVPIPTVPGLSIQVGTKASYEIDASGMQTLEGEIKIGVSYSLLKVLDIYGGAIGMLKLEGKSLEAAFIDCVKQLTKRALETAGIQKTFDDMRRMAKEGPGVTDFLKTLIPFYGPIQSLKIAVSQVGAAGIEQLVTDYNAFFVNDTSVGFEVAAGFYGGLSLGWGDNEASIEGQVLVGLEDKIGESRTRGFVEINGAVELAVNGIEVGVTVAKRWLEGGKSAFTIKLESEFPLAGLDQGKAIALGTAFASAAGFQAGLGAVGSAGQDTNLGSAINQIGQAFLSSAAVYAISSAIGSRSVGLDIELENVGGTWSVTARFKTMNTFKKNLGLVETKVQAGNYVDISGEFKSLLPKTKPSNTSAGKKMATISARR